MIGMQSFIPIWVDIILWCGLGCFACTWIRRFISEICSLKKRVYMLETKYNIRNNETKEGDIKQR